MATKEQILRILAENKDRLQAGFKVRRIALFGSYARGEQREDSDIDILVDVDPSIGLDFVTLCETIERLLGTHVDVVSSRAVKPSGWKVIEPELIYV
jgi:predicted nucleotidyltransferase